MSHVYAIYPSLKDRKVVVTGGATGIGVSFVKEFKNQEAKVAFLDVDASSGKDLKKSLSPDVHFINCDVTDSVALQESIQKSADVLEGIDILINNAAHDKRHEFLNTTEADWDNLMAVNLKHQFFAAQAAVPIMKQNRSPTGGVILNISSGCYVLGTYTRYPVYMTAKAGIEGLTQTLGRELGPLNIRVNAILPGWVITERQKRENLTPETEQKLLNDQSLKEKLMPEDVARVALFLASDDARMITKQRFIVDAGWI